MCQPTPMVCFSPATLPVIGGIHLACVTGVPSISLDVYRTPLKYVIAYSVSVFACKLGSLHKKTKNINFVIRLKNLTLPHLFYFHYHLPKQVCTAVDSVCFVIYRHPNPATTRTMSFKTRPGEELENGVKQAQADGVSPEALQTVVSARDMFRRRDEFTLKATSDHSPTLAKIEDATYNHDWKGMHEQGKIPWVYKPFMYSGKLEGQLLKSLVSMQRAKRILEVGLFTGYGALSMAEALPADGEVVSLELCEGLKDLAAELAKDSPHAKKIRVEVGPALDTAKKIIASGEQFDMIFLDGDKKDYCEFVKMAFDDKLLSEGGTLLIDNAYIMGSAYNPSDKNYPMAMQLLKEVKSRTHLHSVMLPMNDGVLMVRRMKDVERDAA